MTPPDPPRPHVPEALARATAWTFWSLARLRGARPFHPRGASFHGILRPFEEGAGVPFLAGPETPVLVRLSAALGLRRPWPDIMGIGIRVRDAYGPGRHQDLLLASSSRAPVLRHLLVPTRGLDRRSYSSLLAYRHAGQLVLVGCRWASRPAARPVHPDDLRQAAPKEPLRFELTLGRPTGRWLTVAALELGQPLSTQASAELRFDPWNAAKSFQPVGPLNHLRAAAYRASQRATTSP